MLPATIHFSHLPDFLDCALLISIEPVHPPKTNPLRSFSLWKAFAEPPILKYWAKLNGHRDGETKSLGGKTFEHFELGGEGGSYCPKRKEEIIEFPPGYNEYSIDLLVEIAHAHLSWKQREIGSPQNDALKEPFDLEISLAVALNLRQIFGGKNSVDLSRVGGVALVA